MPAKRAAARRPQPALLTQSVRGGQLADVQRLIAQSAPPSNPNPARTLIVRITFSPKLNCRGACESAAPSGSMPARHTWSWPGLIPCLVLMIRNLLSISGLAESGGRRACRARARRTGSAKKETMRIRRLRRGASARGVSWAHRAGAGGSFLQPRLTHRAPQRDDGPGEEYKANRPPHAASHGRLADRPDGSGLPVTDLQPPACERIPARPPPAFLPQAAVRTATRRA